VDDGVATAVLFYGKRRITELTSVDSGDNLLGEGVVLNELLVDRVGDEHVAVGDIQTMSSNASTGQDWDGHAGEDQSNGDEFWELYLEASPSKRLAELLCFPQQRGFSSGGHIS
jgi:hypothetical protein